MWQLLEEKTQNWINTKSFELNRKEKYEEKSDSNIIDDFNSGGKYMSGI